MIRITLTSDMREALHLLHRDPSLSPGERDRVEMLFLSEEGSSPPRIGAHLGYHPKTMRLVLKGFLENGTSSQRHRPSGPAPNLERKERIISTLDSLLGESRTWTAAQLAEALTAAGYPLSARQTRKCLKAMGTRWRGVRSLPLRTTQAAAPSDRGSRQGLTPLTQASCLADGALHLLGVNAQQVGGVAQFGHALVKLEEDPPVRKTLEDQPIIAGGSLMGTKETIGLGAGGDVGHRFQGRSAEGP